MSESLDETAAAFAHALRCARDRGRSAAFVCAELATFYATVAKGMLLTLARLGRIIDATLTERATGRPH